MGTTAPVRSDPALDRHLEQLDQAGLAIARLEAEATSLRPIRHGLIFAGVDRYFFPERRCLARENDQPCQAPHSGLGLCLNHLRRYRNGLTWGPGGLNMDHEPVTPPDRKWKKIALELSGISHWVFLSTVKARRYRLGDGVFTADPEAAAEIDQHGTYWLELESHEVVEVPVPPDAGDAVAHWTQAGAVHTEIKSIQTAIDTATKERRAALWALFPHERSNRTLARHGRLGENSVYRERVKWQQELAARASA